MAKPILIKEPAALKPHPAASIFPALEGAALEQFTNDIAKNGLRAAITLHEGLVLDGRNRLAACLASGEAPRFVAWNGKGGSPVEWVASMNLHRRHLDESQRAIVAARMREMLTTTPSGTSKRSQVAEATSETGGLNLGPRRTADAVAQQLNVSGALVEAATSVLRKGVPDLVAAVERGDVSVSAAKRVAQLPQKEQRRHIEKGTLQAKAKDLRQSGKESVDQKALEIGDRYREGRRSTNSDVKAMREVVVAIRVLSETWSMLVSTWDGRHREHMLPALKRSRERELEKRLDELRREFDAIAKEYAEVTKKVA